MNAFWTVPLVFTIERFYCIEESIELRDIKQESIEGKNVEESDEGQNIEESNVYVIRETQI